MLIGCPAPLVLIRADSLYSPTMSFFNIEVCSHQEGALKQVLEKRNRIEFLEDSGCQRTKCVVIASNQDITVGHALTPSCHIPPPYNAR